MSEAERLQLVVVDDDEGHVELVRRNLARVGLRDGIVALRSGADALAYFFGRDGGEPPAPHLLLLDINMPGSVDGVEVLRRLKTDPERRRIPVIMLTTTDDPREVERCYRLGCSVYITKPVDHEKFVEAIRRLGLFLQVVQFPPDPREAAG